MTSAALVILARYPRPGRVKTRLARVIGAAAAARIHRAFLADLRDRFSADPSWDLFWAYDPPGCNFVPELAPAERAFPQVGGDLGARMEGAMREAFARGYPQVALIGSDLPHLPRESLVEAFREMSGRVVLGPAEDGGYYLIGAEFIPPVFDSIAWGREDVLRKTRERLDAGGFDVHLLPPAYDLDRVTDLRRLLEDLDRDSCPNLAATRRAIAVALGSTTGR